jgi:uncharacterized cupredoxin-like copper-binding protein
MRARMAAAATGLLAAAVLSACSSGDSGSGTAAGGGSSSSSSSSSSSASSSSSSPAGTSEAASGSGAAQSNGTVEVEAADFTLSLPSSSLSPGQTTFEMRNDGNATHAIEIDGPGVEDQKSSTAGPGGTATLTVTLQPGKYTMYCPVGNHRAMGMQTTFTVG